MNPSDLYHQHGVREQVCTRAEYGSKTIVLHIKTKRVEFYCPKCKSTGMTRIIYPVIYAESILAIAQLHINKKNEAL